MNTLTLYHSTTDFYLPSIKRLGLGGINPNYSLGILGFLRVLHTLSDKYLSNNPEYLKIQYSTQCMANQTINNFDFRHDKVYLSINESTAIRYSISNEYGSELLTRCLFLYNLLQKNDYQEKIDMSMLKVDINDIMNKKYTKILLKIKNVAPEYLETEREEDIVEKIKEMNFLKETDELLYYALSQQCNFKLKTPINFQELEVYKILVEYDTKNGQTYKLEDYFD